MRSLTLCLLLAAACGDEPPPLSATDGAVLCLNQTASEYVPCPEDEQLCWHLVIDAPQICPDDGVDGGPVIRIPDGGLPVLDGGNPEPDAFIPEGDAGVPGPDLSAEPDAFVPPTLDPDLEVWPTGTACDAPGEVLTGGVFCAFGEGRTDGGVRLSPVALSAPYGVPIGGACEANETTVDGDRGQCRRGVCFAGVCTRPCELGVDVCAGTPFAGCETVGHETHGVCWGAP